MSSGFSRREFLQKVGVVVGQGQRGWVVPLLDRVAPPREQAMCQGKEKKTLSDRRNA